MTAHKKAGRPRLPEDLKLYPRSVAFSNKEMDFLLKQKPSIAGYVRALVRAAMKEAGTNDDK